MKTSDQNDLGKMVEKLGSEDMPMFSATAKLVSTLSAKDESSISELKIAILKDPALTAKVLRLAGSMHYSRQPKPVATVSRAVVQLGFDTVKSICLSASLVEVFLKGSKRERVVGEMATAIHAALQARKMSTVLKDPAAEEIFVASLLHRIGHVAFWSFGGPLADRLEQEIATYPGLTQEEVERQVLGYSLNELTATLVDEWRLGDLVGDSLKSAVQNSRVRAIRLGHALAGQAARHGFESSKFAPAITAVGKFLRIDEDDAKRLVEQGAAEAVSMAQNYGIKGFGRFIPLDELADSSTPPPELKSDFLEPDIMLQLELLGDLLALHQEKRVNFASFLSTLMEGILRGLGTDRVLFSIMSSDRNSLKGRYGLGWSSDEVERFEFITDPANTTAVSLAISEKSSLWFSPKSREFSQYLTFETNRKIGADSFFLGPVVVRGKVIGVICADRKMSGRILKAPDFISFQFFINSANAILSASL